MILLTNNPKGNPSSAISKQRPTVLKLARLDGATKNSKVDDSTINRTAITTAKSCTIPNASAELGIRMDDTTISRSTIPTLDNQRSNPNNRCRPQNSVADMLPIPTVENCCAKRLHSCTTEQIDRRRIPKQQSEQETKVQPAASPSLTSTTIRADRHQQQHRRQGDHQMKFVRFDSVHIREHSVTVRDHDRRHGTIAVTLDWPHAGSSRSIALDEYESIRERQGRTPRGRLRRIGHWRRKQLLLCVGGNIEDSNLLECRQQ